MTGGSWQQLPSSLPSNPWRRLADLPVDSPPPVIPFSITPDPEPFFCSPAFPGDDEHWEQMFPGDADDTPGVDGRTILNGHGNPASNIGVDGDFYIDTLNWLIYGPKTSGAWGSGTSLIGPPGSGGSGSGHVGTQFRFLSPAATWTVSVPAEYSDRMPVLSVMTSDGELVVADVVIDSGLITVTFSQPQTGTLILA